MKKLIHVDIENPEGEVECYEREGGFFIAFMSLFAVWRYGKGRVQIGEDEDNES